MTTNDPIAISTVSAKGRIPLWLKVAYTAFLAVLVPVYWFNYGPTNFLYFCDVALLVTLVGMWRESALLVSMAAVGILLPQLVWVADFLAGLAGFTLTGMTAYMFNAERPLFLRGLSLFHGWLPLLLLVLVWRLGYDRRAFWAWTGLAWTLMVVCVTLMPGPRPDAGQIATPVNINYMHGLSDTHAQAWMPGWAWVAVMLVGMPLLIFLPTHLALRRICRQPSPA